MERQPLTGKLFDIQRFSVHDGPGIRTTLFLRGCPLSCLWCHNPESRIAKPTLMFYKNLCIGCRQCETVCQQRCHRLTEDKHEIDRACCVACARCTEACPCDALRICGTEYTPEQAASAVLRDLPFYGTDGGVTFSGGEPLLQADFVAETAEILRGRGVQSCAVDTCGEVPWDAFERVLPVTDLFLYDIKSVSADRHQAGTGRDNRRIIENLTRLDRTGRTVWIRIPFIHGVNDDREEREKIVSVIGGLQHVERISVFAYHSLGSAKYEQLGLPCTMSDCFEVSTETADDFRRELSAATGVFVEGLTDGNTSPV